MRSDPVSVLEGARTLLFVPGDQPGRFAKAVASGADLVIMDLEDAVDAQSKDQARAEVAAGLDAGVALGVRINAVGTPWHDDDVAMVGSRECVVVLPKAEKPQSVAAVAGALGATSAILALVETAAGILNTPSIALEPKVARLALGSFDLADELGVSPDDRDALAASRGQLVLASAAAGIAPPVDGVTGSVDDEDALTADLTFAWRLGFTGKLCIHPRQVTLSARKLSPSPGEVAWAEKVMSAATSGESGAVVVVDGQMVDRPVVRRAARILARVSHD
jgi:citrate lyase subunit beta / citryl-CoA lyase